MDYKMPKFLPSEAKTKEEKLIIELETDLYHTMTGFISLNKSNMEIHELFSVIKDGSLAYVGRVALVLARMLSDKKEMPRLLKEIEDIFDCYIQQAKETMEKE